MSGGRCVGCIIYLVCTTCTDRDRPVGHGTTGISVGLPYANSKVDLKSLKVYILITNIKLVGLGFKRKYSISNAKFLG